jgi:hypothetical protein
MTRTQGDRDAARNTQSSAFRNENSPLFYIYVRREQFEALFRYIIVAYNTVQEALK